MKFTKSQKNFVKNRHLKLQFINNINFSAVDRHVRAYYNQGKVYIFRYGNDGKSIEAYEQTPVLAKKSDWSYSKLLKKKYLPFSKK